MNRTTDSGPDHHNEVKLKSEISRGSSRNQHQISTQVGSIMQPINLPAVRNPRGNSNDAQNFLQMSGSKNSAKLVEMRTAAFEESQQPHMANQQRYGASFRNSRQRGQSYQQTMSQPSNYELAAMRSGFDPSHDATIKDFQQKNIGDLKAFKTTKITGAKEQIEIIHGQLRMEQGL